MPVLIDFKDAVNASVLDPRATHAVYYMDGHFQNEEAVRARCPQAKLYAITTRGATGHGIFALDSENGDVDTGARGSFPQTEAWVAEQVRLGVQPVVVYANQDRWLNLGLLKALERYGDRVERWDADFDGSAVVPSWASAKQYASTNVDLNVAVADFFGDATPVDPHHYDWFPTGPFSSREWGQLNEREIVLHYDGARKHWLRYRLFLGKIRAQLRFLADRVAHEAITADPVVNPDESTTPSWGKFHRGWRYQQLAHRAQGQRLA